MTYTVISDHTVWSRGTSLDESQLEGCNIAALVAAGHLTAAEPTSTDAEPTALLQAEVALQQAEAAVEAASHQPPEEPPESTE